MRETHCHSLYSDGVLSCPELFQLAQSRGVEHLALTDPDTAAGYRASIEQNWVPAGLTLYPAAELSCVWQGRTIHVVGLGIDVYSDQWRAVEHAYIERRELRFLKMVRIIEQSRFNLRCTGNS